MTALVRKVVLPSCCPWAKHLFRSQPLYLVSPQIDVCICIYWTINTRIGCRDAHGNVAYTAGNSCVYTGLTPWTYTFLCVSTVWRRKKKGKEKPSRGDWIATALEERFKFIVWENLYEVNYSLFSSFSSSDYGSCSFAMEQFSGVKSPLNFGRCVQNIFFYQT